MFNILCPAPAESAGDEEQTHSPLESAELKDGELSRLQGKVSLMKVSICQCG